MLLYSAAILLLLESTITIVSSQTQECLNLASELESNQNCQNAINALGNSIVSGKPLTMSDLQIFCVNPCKDLVKTLFGDCVSCITGKLYYGFIIVTWNF